MVTWNPEPLNPKPYILTHRDIQGICIGAGQITATSSDPTLHNVFKGLGFKVGNNLKLLGYRCFNPRNFQF